MICTHHDTPSHPNYLPSSFQSLSLSTFTLTLYLSLSISPFHNLRRELAEKEEANLQLEEHFSSMQEEVEVKTKKLKKLFAKYQGAVRETQDLQEVG